MSTEDLESLNDIDFNLILEALRLLNRNKQLVALEVKASLTIEQVDLEHLAEAIQLFGITDPIGQLASWIYDRLKEIASWFASTVNTIIAPIKSAVDSVYSFLSSVYRAVTDIFSYVKSAFTLVQTALTESVSRLWEFLKTIATAVGESAKWLWSNIQNLGDSLLKGLDALGKTLAETISDIATTIREAITVGITALGSALTSLIDKLWSALTTIGSTIIDGLTALGSKILDFFTTLGTALVELGERFWSIITTVASTIMDGLSALGSKVVEFFTALGSALAEIGERIWSILTTIGSTIMEGFASLGARIVEFFSALGEALASIGERLWSGLTSIGGAIIDGIMSLGAKVAEFFSALGSAIVGLGERLWSGLLSIGESLSKVITSIAETIVNSITAGITTLFSALTNLGEKLWEGLTTIATTIVNALSTLGDKLLEYLRTIGSAIVNLGERVWAGLLTISDIILSSISSLIEHLSTFAKYVQDFGAMVLGGIANIGTFIQGFFEWLKGIPEQLSKLFAPIVEFFTSLGKLFLEFISNPLEFLSQKVLTPLWNALVTLGDLIWKGLSWLGGVIVQGIQALGSAMRDVLSALWSGLSAIFSSFVEGLFGALQAMGAAVRGIFSRFISYFLELLTGIGAQVTQATNLLIQPVISRLFGELKLSTVPYLNVPGFIAAWGLSTLLTIPFLMYPLLVSIPVRALSFGVRGLAMSLSNLKLEKHISLKPLGLGTEIRLDFVRCIGAALYTFGDELTKFVDKFYEPIWLGLGFWFSRYMTLLITFFIRNYIPIEFPTLKEVEEAWLKARVAEVVPPSLGEKGRDIQEAMLYYLKIKGYSDFLLDYQFASPEELYTTLIDRFGVTRKVPLGGVWKLPSVADVARMWVRDVLRPPGITAEELMKNLVKIYEAAGLYRDIGLLYTLLAFRYPSPRELAEFYWRGIAKTLWLETTLEEAEWKQLFSITWTSTSPYNLNISPKRTQILNNMINLYLKWHDLFPAPWAPEFPTDKAIVAELMAELPTRIDLRWLTRWGIFQHMAEAGVDVMADLKTIYSKFVTLTGEETRSEKVTPEIKLDARFLARFLIATRMNPLVVPLVSIAQVHAVLSSELTLLRSGFIEALRRGFITLDMSEILMSGLIKIEFLTGYIDPVTGEFHEVKYPKPVFWLPAERRLLQLRAILDRYNVLMRDLLYRITWSIMYIAIFPEEGAAILRSFHAEVSEHTRKLVKAISGVDWKPELDAEYMNVWLKYGSMLIPIGARTWIRRYVSRYLGWIFYRLLYGWITFEDFKRIVDTISTVKVNEKEIKVLTDVEIAFFYQISRELAAIIRKENIPSPSTLAVFAEYMVISEETIKEVLAKHRVPEEYWDLWERYISVKPVKVDYKALITTAVKALRRNIISKEELEKILKEALEYGFTPKEIELIQRRAELEEAIDESKEWRPTLLTLISISEYVTEAVKLLEHYKVDPVFKPIVEKYAYVKPLADEVRVLVNALYRAKRYTTIPRELEEKAVSLAKQLGITDQELAIRDLALELTVLADEAKTWLPAPATIATLSEYLTVPRELVEAALKARRIPEEWAKIWIQYIEVRPLKADYKSLIATAVRALKANAISEESFKKILEDAKNYGFTPREIEILQRRVELELAIEASKEWSPTVLTLIGMLETVPEAIELLKLYPVKKEFSDVIVKYAERKPVADELRALISAYYRAKRYAARYAQVIPREIEVKVEELMKQYGVTEVEKSIRDLASELEIMIDMWKTGEVIPTLSALATMAEYIEIPHDYIIDVLRKRRVETTYAELWLKYISAREISTEVGRVVSAFQALYVRFTVPDTVVEAVKSLMLRGGWTARELEIFELELYLRRQYRILTTLIPTMRGFLSDGTYLPNYEKLLEDLFTAYGIDPATYKKQLEYYKALLKNRRLWRHFSWYRTQLTYAYQYGAITEDEVKRRLEKFKNIGLVDDDEIAMIIEGMKLRKAGYSAYRAGYR